MRKKLLLLQGLAMLFTCHINYALAQVPDSCTFVEGTTSNPSRPVRDSVLTIEMESTNVNGGFWVVQNDIPGYLGSGFIQYVGGDATGVPGISQLSYTFRIVRPGIHSFKMRAYREDYHDNDVWVRFPHGGVFTRIGADSTGSKGNEWFKVMIGKEDAWYAFAQTQHLSTYGEKLHDIYVDFPTAGVYTVEFSGRATGFRIDRFYLYKTNSFYGMGTAEDPTPESAKENCVPYAVGSNPYVSNPIADQNVNGGTSWSFTVPSNTFTNPAGTPLNYQAFLGNMQPLPSWMTFNHTTRQFTGSPTYENGGKYTILVKAQSGSKFAVDAFVLTVNGNNPPTMVIPLADTTAEVEELFSYDISSYFHDIDDHTLTFTADSSHEGMNLPAWLSFSGSTFSGTPGLSDVGKDTIYITVDDGNGGSISESFIINVKAPVIQSIRSKKNTMTGIVYPNPTGNVVNIKVEGTGRGTITILDNFGKVFYSDKIILSEEATIDISSMHPGSYIIRVKSDDQEIEYSSVVIKK